MNYDVYVYDEHAEVFASLGLVGPLEPTKCVHEEIAGGMSQITLEHPIDPAGKWRAIQRGNVIKAWVPVRTTPEIRAGQIVTTIEKWTVKNTATKNERYIYSKKSGGSKTKLLNGGTEVTVTAKPTDSDRYKVKSGKYSGWMEADALNYVTEEVIPDDVNGMETVEPSWQVKPQLFRITEEERTLKKVTATARHITYDLLGNMTRYKNDGSVGLQAALDGIFGNCVAPHDFTAVTNIADTRTGVDWDMDNPVNAIMDPETGVMGLWRCDLIRDNWEMFLLDRAGMDRGASVEYGRDMLGVNMEINEDSVVTRIVPTGEQKDGTPLYLDGEIYMDSEKIDDYAVPHIYHLECKNCRVGTDDVTTAIARARMREQAQEMFDGGCDEPNITMTVDFIQMDDAGRNAFAPVMKLFLYDYVLVRALHLGIETKLRVVRVKWDCLTGRPDETELGTVEDVTGKIANYQIGGISGGKIFAGTVGPGAIASDAISVRHVQADSINANALQAGSVTAEKIASGVIETGSISAVTAKMQEIVAQELTTDELYAALAEIVRLRVGEINAETITTDTLAAVLGDFMTLYAKTAEFDFATAQNFVAGAMVLEQGVGGSVYIENLVATSANFVSAMLGELCLKGEDGEFYDVIVSADGVIKTQERTVTQEEIAAGVTADGHGIVNTTANIQDLNAETVKAKSAVLSEILVASLTADKITAQQALLSSATVPELYVTAINAIGQSIMLEAQNSITLAISDAQQTADDANATATDVRAWIRFTDDGMEQGKEGSTYATLVDDAGFHVLQKGEKISSFAKRQLAVEEVRVGRIGDNGTRCVLREASDGGMIIAVEGTV